MALQVLYFASLRERLGVERESIEWSPGLTDLDSLLAELRGRGGVWGEVLADNGAVLMALNQEMAKGTDSIRDGDEVGLFPPVTGG